MKIKEKHGNYSDYCNAMKNNPKEMIEKEVLDLVAIQIIKHLLKEKDKQIHEQQKLIDKQYKELSRLQKLKLNKGNQK